MYFVINCSNHSLIY